MLIQYARQNRKVFRCVQNCVIVRDGSRTESGNEFHSDGPETEKLLISDITQYIRDVQQFFLNYSITIYRTDSILWLSPLSWSKLLIELQFVELVLSVANGQKDRENLWPIKTHISTVDKTASANTKTCSADLNLSKSVGSQQVM